MRGSGGVHRNDFLWNALGSFCYALSSMVLAFMVLRIAGPRDGGIFGFGFSTLGQQLFIVAYFGIRPFHITDMRGEYGFGEYREARRLSCAGAIILLCVYLIYMCISGAYDIRRALILLLLSAYKIADGYSDVYESELQRQSRLYKAGQSLFFRTVISSAALIISLKLFGELLIACAVALIIQILGVWIFAVRALGECRRDEREPGGSGVAGVQERKREGFSAELLRSTGLLFLSVFLDFYVFSSSKYGVDRLLGAEASGIFNILFMPASFIYLLASFMIRPMLTRMAEAYHEKRYSSLRRGGRLLLLSVAAMSLLISLLAFLLCDTGLFVFELMLGESYRGILRAEGHTFILLIIGGGFYALANVQYYILVTLRKQRGIFLSYLTAALIALLTSGGMIRQGGMAAGAVSYLMLMILLFGIFTLWVLYSLHGLGNEKNRST